MRRWTPGSGGAGGTPAAGTARRGRLAALCLGLALLVACRSTIPITFNGTTIAPGATGRGELTSDEKVGVVVVLCAAAALLWWGYEEARND